MVSDPLETPAGQQYSPSLFVDEPTDPRANPFRRDRAPPLADGAMLVPRQLKPLKELKPLTHDKGDEEASAEVELEKCFEDFESACWRAPGSGSSRQQSRLDQLLPQAWPHAGHRTNSIHHFLRTGAS